MRNHLKAVMLAAAATLPFAAGAFTEEDYLTWFKANQTAQPQFVDGDVITLDKADLVRPFIPKEFQSEWIFDGMQMTIKDAGDLSPSDVYKAATEKNKGTAKIASDGALENYAAGRPFDPAEFKPGKDDGWKMVWNWNFRWQNDGLSVGEVHWVWVRRGGEHSKHEIMTTAGGKYAKFYDVVAASSACSRGPTSVS